MRIATFFRTKYNSISAYIDRQYQRALRAFGIEDCPEMQVTASVAVCVLLYYMCLGIQSAINAVSAGSTALTALVTG